MDDNKLRTAEGIAKRFPGLPPALVECYVRNGQFFADLRKFRDRIVHQGAGIDIIFDGDDDFLISESRVRFRDMNIWEERDRKSNGLVPLTPTLGFVIYRTLETLDQFSKIIEVIFQLPPPLVPNFNLFLRGYFSNTLVDVLEDVNRRFVPQAQR